MKQKPLHTLVQLIEKYTRQTVCYYKTNPVRIVKPVCLAAAFVGVGFISFWAGQNSAHSGRPAGGFKPGAGVARATASTPSGALVGTPSFAFPPYVTDSQATPSSAELMRPDVFNLAFLYEEDADITQPSNSYGGRLYQKLASLDSEWMSGIYDLYNYTPERMAAQFGLGAETVTAPGGAIPRFSNIQYQFTDGEGGAINSYSNAKDILSMANTLYYYGVIQDMDGLEAYVSKLWKDSHSCSVRVGDIYYCDGTCMEAKDNSRFEENAGINSGGDGAETRREIAGAGESGEERSADSDGEASEAAVTLTKENETGAEDKPAEGEKSQLADKPAAARNETGTSAQPQDQTMAGALPEHDQNESQDMSGAEKESGDGIAPSPDAQALQNGIAPSSLQGGLNSRTATKNSASSQKSTSSRNASRPACPGHVNFTVYVSVKSLAETGGLCALDKTEGLGSGGPGQWPGWNSETIASARLLAEQDWYALYGINTADLALRTPLTTEEIELYMSMVPQDASQVRKDFIRYALASVGKIPYYWGGKPSSPGYGGNGFGAVISPDVDGRFMRGLDCSGWINWVYWSVTGKSLGAESTSTLLSSGKAVSRAELLPGDICIRTGSMAHVVIFLGWGEDGSMLCIQETSGNINNVEVGVNDSEWQSYRRILD